MENNFVQIIDFLKEAIRNHNTVCFTYDGKKRTVNPHFYGMNGDSLQLHAYQIKGESKRKHLPNWRNFEITGISDFMNRYEKFNAPSPGYNPEGAHYRYIIYQIKTSSRYKV